MHTTTQGIVLYNTRYADKKVISKIYTKDFGLLSLNINIGFSSKSKIKQAIIQPLTQLEFVFNHKENTEIHHLIEAKCNYVYTNLQNDFTKLCISQFLNEVLFKCLKEQSPNEQLFELICNTYQWLDHANENYQDTHVYFLFELTKHLGFYPVNNKDLFNKYFDTIEGKFFSSVKSFPLGFDDYQSSLFSSLFNYSLSNPKKTSRVERIILLECLLCYYKTHVPGFNEIKSFHVLQQLINEL
jgi:DNA repair protein RecO (recombination protein O)